MSQLIQITILPEQQEDKDFILKRGLEKAMLKPQDISDWRIRKRSIDARQKKIKLNMQLEFWKMGETRNEIPPFIPQNVHQAKEIGIIGAGPAGIYAPPSPKQ